MRNLEKMLDEGRALLNTHERYDLAIDEVMDFLEMCGVPESETGMAFKVMSKAFALGIATGARMERADQKRKAIA